MKRLDRVSLISLVVGLAVTAIVLPWSLLTITRATDRVRLQQEQIGQEQFTPPETPALNSEQSVADEPDEIAIPRPVHPARASEPSRAAYSIVPAGSPELAPLEGWVDQPNADRPGRIHTNLKWRWANKAKPKPKVSDVEPMLDEPPNTRFEPGYEPREAGMATGEMLAVAWSGPDARAQDHAKRRNRDGEYTKTERRSRDNNSDRARERSRDRSTKTDAQRRHPRPDGHYDRNRSENRHDYDRYHWRKYSVRQRWDRVRFPQRYLGLHSFFHGLRYRAHTFGPHDRLWYSYRNAWRLFYWPYPDAPAYGCGWYWVPTARYSMYDPYSGEEYWDYTDYQHAYLCFDS